MSLPEPRWLGRLAVDEAHFRQIREHGGVHGLRDENTLESALARPRQRWQYEPDTSIARLAASYGIGLATGHPYFDGNKRAALVVIDAFLARNGVELTATNAQAVVAMLSVAAGQWTEEALAEWIEVHSRPV